MTDERTPDEDLLDVFATQLLWLRAEARDRAASRIRSGMADYPPASVAIFTAIADLIDTVTEVSEAAILALATDTPVDLPADATDIGQPLLHAIDAAPLDERALIACIFTNHATLDRSWAVWGALVSLLAMAGCAAPGAEQRP